MKYKQIVSDSWQIIKSDKADLFVFGFIPSLFGTIVVVFYVSYQIMAFRHSSLFSSDQGINYLSLLSPIWDFMKVHPSVTVSIVLLVFFILLMYVFSPILCGGALIDLVTKRVRGKRLQGGFSKGLQSFFPLFEFAAMTSVFSVTGYFTELSVVLRNFGAGTWVFLIPLLTTILVIGIFLSLLFIFVPQFIVLENMNVIQAMKKSAVLVLGNVKNTFFLGITLALIALRIVFNMLLILLIPLFFMTIVALTATLALQWLGIIIGTVVGLGLLIVGAYLLAGFFLFTHAVWTLSFIRFRKEELENQ